jgi:hypothetical protein
VSKADVMRLKVRALLVLAAALEGRKDKQVAVDVIAWDSFDAPFTID